MSQKRTKYEVGMNIKKMEEDIKRYTAHINKKKKLTSVDHITIRNAADDIQQHLPKVESWYACPDVTPDHRQNFRKAAQDMLEYLRKEVPDDITKEEINRAARIANGILEIEADLGPTTLASRGEKCSLANAVERALKDTTHGYLVSPEGRGLTPEMAAEQQVRGTPMTAEWILNEAKQHSASFPAIAAFTLISPMFFEGNLEMRRSAAGKARSGCESSTCLLGPTSRYDKFEQCLHQELLQHPPFKGISFRACSFQKSGYYCEIGSILTWPQPSTSTTDPRMLRSLLKKKKYAWSGKPHGTIFVIHSNTGRRIRDHSVVRTEEEVVFLANTQFRITNHGSSAVEDLLSTNLKMNLEDVDILTLHEVRLVVWSDVIDAMSEVERASYPKLVTLLNQVTDAALRKRDCTLDKAGTLVPGAPMTVLPPRGTGGATVVHLAVDDVHTVGVLQLVTYHLKPRDIDEPNAAGKTPLAIALAKNNTNAAVHLMRSGASFRAVSLDDTLGHRLLLCSIKHLWLQAAEIVREILKTPAAGQFASRNDVVKTAAGIRKEDRAQQALQLLRNTASEPLDTTGCLSTTCGLKQVSENHLRWMVEKMGVQDDCTAFSECIRNRNYHLIRPLKEFRFDVDGKDETGRTAAHHAITLGDLNGLDELHGVGASVDAADSMGWTLVHEAVVLRDCDKGLQILQKLKEWGANVCTKDVNGATPLWIASDIGNYSAVRELLNSKLDVDARDRSGTSPIMIAALNGHHEIVHLLAHKGADVNHVNEDKRSAAWLAAAMDRCNVLNLDLRPKSFDFNQADRNGMTAVHIAAQEGLPNVIAVLYDKGANMTAVDNRGWNALHHATSKNRVNIIGRLVRTCRVDPSQANKDGDYPIHIAAGLVCPDSSNKEMLKQLITPNSINATNAKGLTPLDIAMKNERVDMAVLIRDCGTSLNIPAESASRNFGTLDSALVDVPANVTSVVFLQPPYLPSSKDPRKLIKIAVEGTVMKLYENAQEAPSISRVGGIEVGMDHFGPYFMVSKQSKKESYCVYIPHHRSAAVVSTVIHLADKAELGNSIRQEWNRMCSDNASQAVQVRASITDLKLYNVTEKGTLLTAIAQLRPQYKTSGKCALAFAWEYLNKEKVWSPLHETSEILYVSIDYVGMQLRVKVTPDSGEPASVETGPIKLPTFAALHFKAFLLNQEIGVEYCEGSQWCPGVLAVKDKCLVLTDNDGGIVGKEQLDDQYKVSCDINPESSRQCIIKGLRSSVILVQTRPDAAIRHDGELLIGIVRLWSAVRDTAFAEKVLGKKVLSLISDPTLPESVFDDFMEQEAERPVDLIAFPQTAAEKAQQLLMAFKMSFAKSGSKASQSPKPRGRRMTMGPTHQKSISPSPPPTN